MVQKKKDDLTRSRPFLQYPFKENLRSMPPPLHKTNSPLNLTPFLLSQTSYIYIHDDTCMHIWAFIRGLSLTPLSYSCSTTTTTTTTTAAFIFCQLLLKQQQQKQQLILSPFQSSPPSNVGQAIYYILPYSFLSSSSVPFSSPLLSPLTISLSLPLSHTSLGCSPFFSPLYCFS